MEKRRISDRQRRQAETSEKCRARLDRQKAYRERRKISETEDQRAARLAQLSCNRQERLSSETEDQRAARLAQLSRNRQERLSSETEDQRPARLAQLSRNQQERLFSETPEERQCRLQCDRDVHQRTRVLRSQSQKVEKYHADLANLSSASVCSTCNELVQRSSHESSDIECIRCSRDSSSPKLYSESNKMNPGPVPCCLQVKVILMSNYLILLIEFVTGGGDANITDSTCHVNLSSPPWPVWLQWSCSKPATGCCHIY